MASPEILIDITDPKAIKASEDLISPSLYKEVLARAKTLAGVIVEFNPQPDPPGRQGELNPQPLPPRRFVIWNGIVPPDSDWFYQLDANGASLGIKVSDSFAVPAQHASLLTADHHAHLAKHANTVHSLTSKDGGGHIFIGIRIDPQ